MRVLMTMRSQAGVPGRAGVPGGQIGTAQLARALAQLGAQVTLFVGGPRMDYLDGLDDVSIRYLRWPVSLDSAIGRAPTGAQALGRRLRQRRWLEAVTSLPEAECAEVIHVQGLQDAEALLTKLDGPLVVTHWGRAGRWLPGGTGAAGDRALAQRSARIRASVTLVALGRVQAQALSDAGVPPAAAIPPGVDLRHFRPGGRAGARRAAGLPHEAGIVLYVGRLAPDKNVATLLTAFAALSASAAAARLLVIGDGPARADLVRLARELGIEAAVTFVPFVPHYRLPSYYQAADVAVVPSDRVETFCMVALEAIACGCPLIVTDQVPEILDAFPDVPSVAPYHIDDLRTRMADALGGDRRPADDTQIAHFDWASIARRYADLYQTALRHPGSP
jgi:glycosyltransferase involved in cell wall biosynthesis